MLFYFFAEKNTQIIKNNKSALRLDSLYPYNTSVAGLQYTPIQENHIGVDLGGGGTNWVTLFNFIDFLKVSRLSIVTRTPLRSLYNQR